MDKIFESVRVKLANKMMEMSGAEVHELVMSPYIEIGTRMKTKVIEQEWVTVDPEHGDKHTDFLIAVKAPNYLWEDKDGSMGGSIKGGWQINQSDLRVFDADEAREYIKLFEKIIEAEESGD